MQTNNASLISFSSILLYSYCTILKLVLLIYIFYQKNVVLEFHEKISEEYSKIFFRLNTTK